MADVVILTHLGVRTSLRPMPETSRTPDLPTDDASVTDVDAGSVEEVAAADVSEHVDSLPEDLDLSNFIGQIEFPNNNRRRIPAVIYVFLGLLAIGLRVGFPDSALTNGGLIVAGVGLIAFGVYGIIAGSRMNVDEQRAFAVASASMDFPVGHASAQQVWRGWFSRPTWRILLYSNENPPASRGIALVDGVNGELVEFFSEPNPEKWADIDTDAIGAGADAS